MEKMGTKSMKELNKKSSNRYFSWEKMQKKIKKKKKFKTTTKKNLR